MNSTRHEYWLEGRLGNDWISGCAHVEQEAFHKIFKKEDFEALVKSGELSFSFEAFQGAMLVSLYRHEPRFSRCSSTSTSLSVITKWRCTSVQSHFYITSRLSLSQPHCAGRFRSTAHSLSITSNTIYS